MQFEMKNLLLFGLLLAGFWQRANCAGYDENDEGCRTSDGQSGICVALPMCQYGMEIVKKNGIISWQAQNYLRSNQCGFRGRHPAVCCSLQKDSSADKIDPTTIDNRKSNSDPQTTVASVTTKKPRTSNATLLPFDCGLDESNRIVGGEVTALGEFPWMALLEYRSDRHAQTVLGCGGSLITRRYVLTAAHCIRNVPSYLHLNNVRLGEHNTRNDRDCTSDGWGRRICADPMVSIPIENVIVHENYMSPEVFRNDIALLRLARDAKTSKFIRPICLPPSVKTSQNYWSSGWGAIENRPSSEIKLKVNLPLFDFQQCAVKYLRKKVKLGKGQMCAGGQAGKDTCKGDSGGPLMKQIQARSGPNRWVIDGVLSIGHSPCGLEGWPGVYTKVHDYIPWIIKNLQS